MNTMSEFNPARKLFPENNEKIKIPSRKPEPDEIFNPTEARQYLGCDTNKTADYAIVAGEIALTFGEKNRLHGETIVEVCFGPGNLCGELLKIGAGHVIGIDGSPIMIEHAQKKFKKEVAKGKMEFHLGPAQALSIPDNSVDGIVNFNSFHQFSTIDRATGALQEMARVVKPGGWGFVRDFRRDADPHKLDGRNTNPDIDKLLQESLPAAFSKSEFEDMLLKIGSLEFLVVNAPDPWRLPESVCQRIRQDPVRHWMDAAVSQHVIFKKIT